MPKLTDCFFRLFAFLFRHVIIVSSGEREKRLGCGDPMMPLFCARLLILHMGAELVKPLYIGAVTFCYHYM